LKSSSSISGLGSLAIGYEENIHSACNVGITTEEKKGRYSAQAT
jgi:hypothetical protein